MVELRSFQELAALICEKNMSFEFSKFYSCKLNSKHGVNKQTMLGVQRRCDMKMNWYKYLKTYFLSEDDNKRKGLESIKQGIGKRYLIDCKER